MSVFKWALISKGFLYTQCVSLPLATVCYTQNLLILSMQDGSFYSRLPKIVTEKQFSLTLEAGT